MGIWDNFNLDYYSTLLKNNYLQLIPQSFDPTSLEWWNSYVTSINNARSNILGQLQPESTAVGNYLDYNWNNLSNPTYSDYQSLDPSVQSQVWSSLTPKLQAEFSNQKLEESLKLQGKKGIRGTLIPGLFDSNEKGNDLGFSSLGKAKQYRSEVFANPESTPQQIADAKKSLRSARENVAGQTLGAVGDVLNNVLPNRPEYEGDRGSITAGMDQAYDAIADAIGMVPGWGTLASGILKTGAGVNKLIGLIGGGTDGMCVCAGTKVFTADGRIVNIEDLLLEDGILGWNEQSKLVESLEIQNIISPILKECIEIALKSGLILRCSIDHPILSDNREKASMKIINGKRIGIRLWEFRRANELKVGNFVALANSIDFWGNEELFNAYLVGLLIGDGTYTKGNSCRLWTADESTWDYIESNNLGVINNCNGSKKYNKETRTYRIINGMDIMRQLGIVYLHSENKTLPINIGKYSKDSICKLIAGIFDSDGSFSINDKNLYSINLYQTNLNLLNEIKQLLHKLGIFCTILKRKEHNYIINGRQIHSKESYTLNIHEKHSTIKFYENIPINIDYKKKNLEKIYNYALTQKCQEHYLISGAKLSKIISIKNIGLLIVYNLSTLPNHTYLANGIITHNTNTDAILGSSFLGLTPFGMINGFGGKRADTFTKDNQAFALVGGSYTGSSARADEALEKSNKKYGLFSEHQRHRANEQIAEAKRQLNIISGISDESLRRNTLRGSMSGIRSTRRAVNRNGGYNQSHTRAGRQGLKFSPFKAKKLVNNVTFRLYLKGGPISDYIGNLVQSALLNSNVRFIQRLLEKPTKWIETPDGRPGSHLLAYETDKYGNTYVFPLIMEDENGNLKQYGDEAAKIAKERGDYIIMNTPEDAKLFTSHYKEYLPEWMEEWEKLVAPYLDENGKVKHEIYPIEPELTEIYKLGGVLLFPAEPEIIITPIEPELIQLFLNGGEINVIPDGALHKNLHHMEDAENLTKKGIPVVAINDGEQVAEIETSEIILRKSVTEKLEELCELYYSEDATKELKDTYTLEAGELLVDEIINNTIDKTNKLL